MRCLPPPAISGGEFGSSHDLPPDRWMFFLSPLSDFSVAEDKVWCPIRALM